MHGSGKKPCNYYSFRKLLTPDFVEQNRSNLPNSIEDQLRDKENWLAMSLGAKVVIPAIKKKTIALSKLIHM